MSSYLYLPLLGMILLVHVPLLALPPLEPCPDSPNCVSSKEEPGSSRFTEPLPASDISNPIERMRALLSSWERVEVIEESDVYLHVTFTSRWWGFIDDVEFVYDKERATIDIRSASREGYYDLGANKSRVKRIRKAWNALLAEQVEREQS